MAMMSPIQKNLIAVQKRPNRFVMFVKNNSLLLAILLSIVVGFGVGLGMRAGLNSSESYKIVRWFTLPGKLFIRALELLVVPVILVGVTAATSSLSPKNNLRITLICVGLVLLTHVAATLVGLAGSLILVAIPSAKKIINNNATLSDIPEKQKDTYDIIADILYNLIPKNIVRSTTSQEITKYYGQIVNGSVTYSRKTEYVDGSNILGILTFSILIGLASSVLEDKAKLFRDFFKSCNDVVILALRWLIMFAPIGIASLIIDAVFEVEDLAESFKQIGVFAALCVAALLFYGVFVLALIIFVLTRKNPFRYYYYFLEPALLAFASTSGAVCIHKSLEICDQKVKMDPRLSKFTIPFFTALQADGSAIFITMSCAFVANYSGISLSAGDYAVIVIMTSILCLCLPSVPSSSIVTILVVLNAVNVDPSNIAILYTFEWLLDRVRTAVNLYSHCFCAVITYELNKNKLSNLQFDLPESGNNDLDSSSHREDQVPLNQIRKNHQEVNRAFVVVATNEVPSQNF